jgi:hypothetical protein
MSGSVAAGQGPSLGRFRAARRARGADVAGLRRPRRFSTTGLPEFAILCPIKARARRAIPSRFRSPMDCPYRASAVLGPGQS